MNNSEKNSNRRSFIKSSALLGAFALTVPAVSFSNSAENLNKKRINKIPMRTLGKGKSAFKVSALGLGCMGANYHRGRVPNRQKMIELMQEAVEMGVTLFASNPSVKLEKCVAILQHNQYITLMDNLL